MFRLIQLNLLAESISKIDFMCFYKKKKPCKNKVLSKSWLGRLDSNQRMSAPKADALPLGDAPKKIQLYTFCSVAYVFSIVSSNYIQNLNRQPEHNAQALWQVIQQSCLYGKKN